MPYIIPIYYRYDDIQEVNVTKSLRAVDMNLLVVFDALMSELSVTKAADRLGMSQPAVSNALQRLRHLLEDRLFVRGGDGIRPTMRALELAEPLRNALASIETVLVPTRFDPSTADLTFFLALSDQANICILPGLVQRVMTQAPRVRLECVPKALPVLSNMLEKNQIDVAIGIFTDIPGRLTSNVLFKDRYVCVMRHDHPLLEGPLTLQRLAGERHVLLRSASGARSLFDQLLANHGLRRNVVVTTIQATPMAQILQAGNLVACVLERSLPLSYEVPDDIVIRPVDIDPVQIKMIWHTSTSENSANKWLRAQISAVCAPLGEAAWST